MLLYKAIIYKPVLRFLCIAFFGEKLFSYVYDLIQVVNILDTVISFLYVFSYLSVLWGNYSVKWDKLNRILLGMYNIQPWHFLDFIYWTTLKNAHLITAQQIKIYNNSYLFNFNVQRVVNRSCNFIQVKLRYRKISTNRRKYRKTTATFKTCKRSVFKVVQYIFKLWRYIILLYTYNFVSNIHQMLFILYFICTRISWIVEFRSLIILTKKYRLFTNQ